MAPVKYHSRSSASASKAGDGCFHHELHVSASRFGLSQSWWCCCRSEDLNRKDNGGRSFFVSYERELLNDAPGRSYGDHEVMIDDAWPPMHKILKCKSLSRGRLLIITSLEWIIAFQMLILYHAWLGAPPTNRSGFSPWRSPRKLAGCPKHTRYRRGTDTRATASSSFDFVSLFTGWLWSVQCKIS